MSTTTVAPHSSAAAKAAPTGHSSGFGYKPALDGIRTIAVGSVIAFHFGAAWAPGGFLGVDTFFVLSGYLITSLLLTEWGRDGTVRFAAFWARRARRLLPALFVVLAAVSVWAYFAVDPIQLKGIRSDSLWTLFYGANWHFIASGQSYFGLFSQPSPLRHAWSLAIEEQFYLFWPLITFACLRLGRGRPRYLAAACVVGTIGSVVLLGHLFVQGDPSRAYYGTDTRASQLLVGALLAIVLAKWSPRRESSRRAVQVLGLVGIGLAIAAFATVHDRDAWMYHGGLLAFAVATAFVVTAAVQDGSSPLKSVLSLRPIRWIGQISYGLYLWHWPVVVALNEANMQHGQGLDLSDAELALLRLGATFLFATLSYYLVELPIRHGHVFRSWRALVAAPLGFALTALVIIGGTADAKKPPIYLSAPQGKVLKSPTATTVTTAPQLAAPIPTRWLLMGDSVANSLTGGSTLANAAAAQGITFQARTRSGCGMITAVSVGDDGGNIPWAPGCANTTVDYETSAVRETGAQVVVWLSSWELGAHIVNGNVVQFDTPEGDALIRQELEAALARVTAAGAQDIVFLTMPVRAEHSDLGVPSEADLTRPRHLDRLYRQFAAAHPDRVLVADLADIVCPGGPPCPEFVDGVRLRPRDGGHFAGDGPAYVAPRLVQAIITALRAHAAAMATTTTSAP